MVFTKDNDDIKTGGYNVNSFMQNSDVYIDKNQTDIINSSVYDRIINYFENYKNNEDNEDVIPKLDSKISDSVNFENDTETKETTNVPDEPIVSETKDENTNVTTENPDELTVSDTEHLDEPITENPETKEILEDKSTEVKPESEVKSELKEKQTRNRKKKMVGTKKIKIKKTRRNHKNTKLYTRRSN